jgi:hypothetical protein
VVLGKKESHIKNANAEMEISGHPLTDQQDEKYGHWYMLQGAQNSIKLKKWELKSKSCLVTELIL